MGIKGVKNVQISVFCGQKGFKKENGFYWRPKTGG